MSDNKQISKIVLVKQWLKKKTYKEEKFSVIKTIDFGAKLMGYVQMFGLALRIIRFILVSLYIVLPFLIDLIKLLENLASSLSYNRRSFFMDFTKSRLYGVSNKKYLSELLRLELKTFKNIDKYYEVKPFNKEVNGKNRELYNPSSVHQGALKKIVKMLNVIDFPDYVFGGIPSVSFVDNASRHLGKNYLLLLDISNFFPSTRDSSVYNFFRHSLAQSEDIAKILTDLTTVKNGDNRFLPQGFSTSPILSFLTYYRMYSELSYFSRNNCFLFSAYYDDFTFSSEKFIHTSKRREAIAIIEKYGLKVNKKKTRLVICNHTKITGVIVHKDIKKAPKKLHKKMYDYYRILLKMDEIPTNFTQEDFINTCNKLQGCIAAIQSIERERNLEHYKNTLRYIRKKFDVPIEKKKKHLHFKKYIN